MLKRLARTVLPESAYASLQRAAERSSLTPAARREMKTDAAPVPAADPGPEAVIAATTSWLCRAQDESASQDGGFARDFDLNKGWSESYPETSGYIVPSLISEATHKGDDELLVRARRALDWLVAIQRVDGGFQGGTVSQQPQVSVTFNTGQILLGLAAGTKHFGEAAYGDAMHRAARFLAESLDEDGAWRRHPTPFAKPGDKAYETHVSWGLFEAARVAPGENYGEAGLRQVRWAVGRQNENGWFRDNDLQDPDAPLTHTIGYVLRGVIEAYRLSGDRLFLDAAQKTADALLGTISRDGRIPGQLDAEWAAAADYVCLTGSSQIAACWFLLAEELRRDDYLDAARRANAFVRRNVRTTGPNDIVGGVKGSFPIDGPYGRFQYLNWAAKFTLDAQRMELVADV